MSTVTKDKINALAAYIDGAAKISVVCHTHPDGDAVGSSTAMCRFLRDVCGKDALAIAPDDWPEQLQFIAGDGTIVPHSREKAVSESYLDSSDLLICLDFNNFSRTGELEPILRGFNGPKILIDHHLNPSESDFTLCFSETEISSASELLYSILMMMPGIDGNASALPKDCAVSLMTGMTTDTNNFANSVHPSTLRMASSLLEAGVDRDSIISHIFNEYRINRINAMGYLLHEKLQLTGNGVAFMVLTSKEAAELDIREGETEAFVNIPLAVGDVKFSIFVKEDKDWFRVSIRSKRGWSANRLAAQWFNGGGHEQAAGGRLYPKKDITGIEDVPEYIIKATARFMQEPQPDTSK